jgi:hypothetical protein
LLPLNMRTNAMFELLSTLLRGSSLTPAATDAEAGQALRNLLHQQRATQIALDQLWRRRSALEDRVRQAIAAHADDVAADGARAIAQIENEEATRRHALARIDEKITRLRRSAEMEDGPVEGLDEESTGGTESTGKVEAEDVLVRLRSTSAPTTQFASP